MLIKEFIDVQLGGYYKGISNWEKSKIDVK